MKRTSLFFSLIMIFVLNCMAFPGGANAYSYGDPGEEKMAEAYKELANHVENDDWEKAGEVYNTYKKDFELYFTKTQPDIEKALKEEDKDLMLRSWQAAMRLNIERRLHFAEEQFDDYGQAKLLLAKARGTFTVLEPMMLEQTDQKTVDAIYQAFDDSLKALGNPGLFGIGNQQNEPEVFKEKIEFIISEISPQFPIVSEEEDGSHLTEENLGLFDGMDEGGSSSFWLWFSVALVVILAALIINNKRKQKKQ
ncbi:hypothetical protein JOC78_001842 [Bacillus ectoiniformans]|uniref:hypothetical protein n=1 Tax=Bacillus ectoiniformans TaxID=1494429 RepID=UPI0019578569|nr:hypothetical protein [Bacillus ectoiniformans]MBM7648892.1 hypothetical protein [Bacillus ectoiniformans]